MQSSRVRKFAISVDPNEVVDYAEPLSFFEARFSALGFEKCGTYKFRYGDRECTINAELVRSTDGFEVWCAVQAPDEHEYRLAEVADEFAGYVIAGSTPGKATGTHTASAIQHGSL